MNRSSLFEKISGLFELLTNNKTLLICVATGFLIFVFLMLLIVGKNSKIMKILTSIFLVCYILCVGVLLNQYILKGIDNIVYNIVLNLYFPSISVYLIVFIISFILIFRIMFSNKKKKYQKIISSILFSIISFLYISFLYLNLNAKVDLSDKISIYSNADMALVIQLTMIFSVFFLAFLVFDNYARVVINIFKIKKSDEESL